MSSKIDTNDHIISFEDVHKWFGNFHVLKGINIKIDKGEVVVVFEQTFPQKNKPPKRCKPCKAVKI